MLFFYVEQHLIGFIILRKEVETSLNTKSRIWTQVKKIERKREIKRETNRQIEIQK